MSLITFPYLKSLSLAKSTKIFATLDRRRAETIFYGDLFVYNLSAPVCQHFYHCSLFDDEVLLAPDVEAAVVPGRPLQAVGMQHQQPQTGQQVRRHVLVVTLLHTLSHTGGNRHTPSYAVTHRGETVTLLHTLSHTGEAITLLHTLSHTGRKPSHTEVNRHTRSVTAEMCDYHPQGRTDRKARVYPMVYAAP